MEIIVLVLVLVGIGAAVGGLGRWILPGADPMSFWVTAGIGMVAAVVGGLIGTAVLGPLGAIIFAVGASVLGVYLYRRQRRRPETSAAAAPSAGAGSSTAAATKTCPQCAETVKAEAKVCRFCGHRFVEDAVAVATPAAPQPTAPPAAQQPEPAEIEGPATSTSQPKVARFCSNCGAEFEGDEQFCTSCGTQRD